MAKTLFDKIWDKHVAKDLGDGEVLLYIDRHLVHEVTSPQAFEGLRMQNRPVRHPELREAGSVAGPGLCQYRVDVGSCWLGA